MKKLLVVLVCVLLVGLAVAFAQNPVIETRKYLNQETERIHNKAKGIAEELIKQAVPIVVAKQDILAGDVIQAEMLDVVKVFGKEQAPEGSIFSFEKVIGKRAIVDIERGMYIQLEDLEGIKD